MAVFYNRERSKTGTLTGSIINWSRQLSSNDPEDPNTKFYLPAGYLRCDGSIYSAEIFPQLAEILGTGSNCRYRKPNITLLDNQFQVPDYGSKKIRTSSGSNLGQYIDLYIDDDNGDTIKKSGVGLEVQSNIGTTYEILYQGDFFLPSQTIPITGEPGFTRSTGNYVESSDVLSNAFLPHAHFHDGTRTRIAATTSETSSFGRNSYTRKSTLCVLNWARNTRQELCLYQATRTFTGNNSIVPYESNGYCENVVYGGCVSGGCNFLASYECLIPDGFNCNFPMGSGNAGSCNFGQTKNETTCGNIDYVGPLAQRCSDLQFPGCAIGGLNGQTINGVQSLPSNYSDNNLPFDSAVDSDRDSYSAINNVINQTEVFGNDGTHRHFINFAAQPHTYQVNTRPSFIPAANLVSTIQVQVNEENKADQFIQPYLVQEFLIKY